MILSTRESAATRRELLRLGISQISAGSRTDVGAYHRDTTCDAANFISNTASSSSSSSTVGRPAKTQLPAAAGAEGGGGSEVEEEEDTAEYKLKRGQFCLQVRTAECVTFANGWLVYSTSFPPPLIPSLFSVGPPTPGHSDQGPSARRLHPFLLHGLLPQRTHRGCVHEDREKWADTGWFLVFGS